MGMFVLGLVVGCALCALLATVLFSALGLSIVGKRHRGAPEQPANPDQPDKE